MIAAMVKTMTWAVGNAKVRKSTLAIRMPARIRPEHDADEGADERGDHALVPDHPPRLPARQADRAQHPDLTRALEDGEHERVDDPEQTHDHRQRKQHVEDVQDRVEAGDLVVHELLPRLRLRVREAGEGF